MFYTIYKTTNKLNGKIYIGKHQTENIDDGYIGSGKRLWNSIHKYGIENFEKEILFVFDTEDEMNSKEAELVTKEFCLREDNYNLCPGGKGGWGYINSDEEIIAKRDKYEHKLAGRLAANKVIEKKYGSLYKITKEDSLLGSAAFTKKFYDDGNFRNSVLKNLREANLKSQSPESRQKQKDTMKATNFQQGSKNSQFGKIWITNGQENKKIKREDTIPEGWYKGRNYKFKEQQSQTV